MVGDGIQNQTQGNGIIPYLFAHFSLGGYIGLSKVYRGYVIEDVNGQWYIRNAPSWTSMNAFSPGPHGGWSVATHQVDKLIDFISRNAERDRGKWQPRENNYDALASYKSSNSIEVKNWEGMRLFEKIAHVAMIIMIVSVGIFTVLTLMAAKW